MAAVDQIKRRVPTRLIDLREPQIKRANRFALLAFIALLAAAAATVLGQFGFAALAFALGALLLAFASITASASAAAVATAQQEEHNRQRLAALEHVGTGVWRLVEILEARKSEEPAPSSSVSKSHGPREADESTSQQDR